jgi:hypothetical protein
MNDQCNFCGSFEDILPCSHCLRDSCKRCQLNHAPFCEQVQKSIQRGEGPTVANAGLPEHRAGHVAPPFTPADRANASPLLFIPSAAPVERETQVILPTDVGLLAVEDLLGEE